MKKLTCEMCGNNELLKQGGVFVCTSCQTQYTVEEAKKLMVTNLVDMQSGAVKSDNSAKFANLYKAARTARDSGSIDQAYRKYDQLLSEDPDNWEPNFYASYFEGLFALKNDEPGGTVRISGSRVALNISYRSGISSCIAMIQNCLDTVFALIEEIEDYDEQNSAIGEVYESVMSAAGNLSGIVVSEFERMKREIDHYTRETTDPDAGFIGRGLSKLGDGSSSRNKELRDSYERDISEMVYWAGQQKARLEETAGKRRFDEFWEANQPLKAELEAEKQTLSEQVDALNEEALKTPEKINGYAVMLGLQNKLEQLHIEKSELGILKFKEKQAVQEQIDSVSAEIAPIQAQINVAVEEVEKRIASLTSRIGEIENELTKPRGIATGHNGTTNKHNGEAISLAAEQNRGVMNALRPDKDGGSIHITHTYNDLQIVVKGRVTVYELIVNGMVVGEFKGLIAVGVSAEATVSGTHIKATMSGLTGASKLFINGNVAAKGKMKLL